MATQTNTLAIIQAEVKAPKGQFNSFGKYKYRSAEDILEAVKPVINPKGFSVSISDTIIMLGDRFYVQSIATLTDGKETYSATGYAREEESKKGMDGSQVTGAASSYARKYALNGLFALDDTKDADATNTHGQEQKQSYQQKTVKSASQSWEEAINSKNSLKDLTDLFTENEATITDDPRIIELFKKRKLELNKQ